MTIPAFGVLIDSPSSVLAQLMIDQGVASDPLLTGTATDWPVSVDTELNNPDNVLTLTGTEGYLFGRVQVTGQQSEIWGVQVKLRSKDPEEAYAKINSLTVWMEQTIEFANTSVTNKSGKVSSYRVGPITRKSGPLYLGRGEPSASKRFQYTVNVIVSIIQLS